MKVAITGGIGVGKSFVCRLLHDRGVQVYDCDHAAKRLMATDAPLRSELQAAVGEELYINNVLQKGLLARFILSSEANKRQIESIVHPYVARDFERSGMDWMESAILFEARFDERVALDYVVCVTAPDDVRVARIMQRDHIGRDKAMEWIRCQMLQDEIRRRSDFEIVNDGRNGLAPQLDLLLRSLEDERKRRFRIIRNNRNIK